METCLFVFLILSVDHIVVDTDDPFVKVAVFPAQTNGFTDTASSTKQDSEQGEPMIINLVISHIVNKCRLFCDGQRVTLWLLPVVALFDFRHCSGSRVDTDVVITDGQSKYGVDDGVNNFHRVRLEALLFDELVIESLDI